MAGRVGFNSVDRAFVSICSCKGVNDGTVDNGELFGTDLEEICPLEGLVGGIGGMAVADLGGDEEGCTFDGISETACVGRGVTRGGCDFGSPERFDGLGGD